MKLHLIDTFPSFSRRRALRHPIDSDWLVDGPVNSCENSQFSRQWIIPVAINLFSYMLGLLGLLQKYSSAASGAVSPSRATARSLPRLKSYAIGLIVATKTCLALFFTRLLDRYLERDELAFGLVRFPHLRLVNVDELLRMLGLVSVLGFALALQYVSFSTFC